MESLDVYKTQQMEKLRENYTMQVKINNIKPSIGSVNVSS